MPQWTCRKPEPLTKRICGRRPIEALYLATLGGARALGKASMIGTLDAGKEADLVVVDVSATLPYPSGEGASEDLSAEDVVALCVYRAGPTATVETYVRGKSVYRRPASSDV